MKSVKKSVVSQRQTMDMKQTMLDHLNSSCGISNYAALIKQTKELPGLVKPKTKARLAASDEYTSLEGRGEKQRDTVTAFSNMRTSANASGSEFDVGREGAST